MNGNIAFLFPDKYQCNAELKVWFIKERKKTLHNAYQIYIFKYTVSSSKPTALLALDKKSPVTALKECLLIQEIGASTSACRPLLFSARTNSHHEINLYNLVQMYQFILTFMPRGLQLGRDGGISTGGEVGYLHGHICRAVQGGVALRSHTLQKRDRSFVQLLQIHYDGRTRIVWLAPNVHINLDCSTLLLEITWQRYKWNKLLCPFNNQLFICNMKLWFSPSN